VKQKTGWAVWVLLLSYAAMLGLQLVVTFPLPLDGATWAVMMVVGAYVGADEFASYVTSKRMPKGVKYTGSYQKLLRIVIAMMLLVIEAIVVQSLIPDIELPLDQLMVALGIVTGLFAGGNKAQNAAEGEGHDQLPNKSE
jgi:hypothetical protein